MIRYRTEKNSFPPETLVFTLDKENILDSTLHNEWSSTIDPVNVSPEYRDYHGKNGKSKEFFNYIRKYHPGQANKLSNFERARDKTVKLYEYITCNPNRNEYLSDLRMFLSNSHGSLDYDYNKLVTYIDFLIGNVAFSNDHISEIHNWFRGYANYVFKHPGYDIIEKFIKQR